MRLKVLGSAEDALRAMTEQLIEKMNMRGISPFHLALSGAGTAQQMFGLLDSGIPGENKMGAIEVLLGG